MKSARIRLLAVSCVVPTESLNTQHVFHRLDFGSEPCNHHHLQSENQAKQPGWGKNNNTNVLNNTPRLLAFFAPFHSSAAMIRAKNKKIKSGLNIPAAVFRACLSD